MPQAKDEASGEVTEKAEDEDGANGLDPGFEEVTLEGLSGKEGKEAREKLAKLNYLLKASGIYSKIIADNVRPPRFCTSPASEADEATSDGRLRGLGSRGKKQMLKRRRKPNRLPQRLPESEPTSTLRLQRPPLVTPPEPPRMRKKTRNLPRTRGRLELPPAELRRARREAPRPTKKMKERRRRRSRIC